MHNSFLAFLCLCFCTVLKGQALYGTSGLLHMPTADMQKDKTVMLGGNVLDKHPLSTYWNNKNYITANTDNKATKNSRWNLSRRPNRLEFFLSFIL